MLLRLFAFILVSIGLVWAFNAAFHEKEGVTALMRSAHSGNISALSKLIADGSNIDAKSDYGWTALMFASREGQTDAVARLIDANADVNVTSSEIPPAFLATSGGYYPSTALAEAISNEHLGIANLLLDAGADVQPMSVTLAGGLGDIALLNRMVTLGGDLNQVSKNQFHRTALCEAAKAGNIHTLDWLLTNGADLHLAIPHSGILGCALRDPQPKAVALLIDRGADPDAIISSSNDTALSRAISNQTIARNPENNIEVIRVLLTNGANVNHIPTYSEVSLLETARSSLSRSIAGSVDQKYDPAIQKRYAQSAEYLERVISLLEEFSK